MSTGEQIHKSQSVLRFFTTHQWLPAPRQERCLDVPWSRSCRIARSLIDRHRARLTSALARRWHTLPDTNDWRTAVTASQRVFPGTESWLLYISNREGGWGPFVMNHQGSGAGGWMQFMGSTFDGYVGDARIYVEQRGFTVPLGTWEWTDPLGQALTAGYMRYTHRDGCHWCL
jgi:hypothetical protein